MRSSSASSDATRWESRSSSELPPCCRTHVRTLGSLLTRSIVRCPQPRHRRPDPGNAPARQGQHDHPRHHPIPGRAQPQACGAARRRGHRQPLEILGFNAFAWSRAYGGESRQLWDWRKHPDLMAATWRAAIEAQKDYETIWSLGLRGLNDYAYPGCEGPADCGAVISEAVANQTQLLQEVLGKDVSELDFKFNLWVEALGMYGPLSYRTAARALFDRPFLARFCSFSPVVLPPPWPQYSGNRHPDPENPSRAGLWHCQDNKCRT